METQSEYAPTETIAKLLGVSTSFLTKARVYGDGPPYTKLGRVVRYHVPTVKEWALSRARSTTKKAIAA